MSLETEECEKHLIINCATCKEAAQPKPARNTFHGRLDDLDFRGNALTISTKIAEFDGSCPACGEDIVADYDPITFDSFRNAWVHQDCP